MNPDTPAAAGRYDAIYAHFDSEVMGRFRRMAYGQDVGQHSWVDQAELLDTARQLRLGGEHHLLDLGCGACGPLTWLMANTGCAGTGVELSAAALRSGQARAARLQLETRFSTRIADLNQALPADIGRFDAVMAIDVVLHLRDRSALFSQVRRVLRPGGRFLFTDAGVVTGAVTSTEFARRSLHGHCEFVPAGWNEGLLAGAGLALVAQQDMTPAVVKAAGGRLRAMQAMRAELASVWSAEEWEKQMDFLSVVTALAERGAISRWRYLAEALA